MLLFFIQTQKKRAMKAKLRTDVKTGKLAEGRRHWEFNLQSECFYPLGSGSNLSGVTIRRADGGVTFVPIHLCKD